MGEIHVSDCEEIFSEEIESVKIWSDYDINQEVEIKLKNGETRCIICENVVGRDSE